MPRKPRLDIPGFLYHVYIRGIQRGAIFLDERDRSQFAERLSDLLVETATSCLAWSFMTNHAHFLLRPKEDRLSTLMRRLLTGYAVWFNKRHQRSGYLFQNRFSSSICQEDPYLLELTRYIHLNPVRSRIVPSLKELETYPWTGHPVILGHREFPGQDPDTILALFGGGATARMHYLNFLARGIGENEKPMFFEGMGVNRSNPDLARVIDGKAFKEKVENTSDQILFLEKPSLDHIFSVSASVMGMNPDIVAGRTLIPKAFETRALAAYLAVKVFGYGGAETGRFLGVCRSAVCSLVRKGEEVAESVRGWEILLRE